MSSCYTFIVSPARFSGGETYRDHYQSSCVVVGVGVTKKFCHIFLGNHRGQLPDIWHRASVWRTVSCNAVLNLRHIPLPILHDFEYCGHRQICSQDNFCHIFLGNHRGHFPDIWHRASVWRTVSCNAVLIFGMSTSCLVIRAIDLLLSLTNIF